MQQALRSLRTKLIKFALRRKLLSMYGDVSSSLKAQAKAVEAKDTNAQTKAKQDLETAAGKESDLVDSINTLCAK
jgi:hypothetical protein